MTDWRWTGRASQQTQRRVAAGRSEMQRARHRLIAVSVALIICQALVSWPAWAGGSAARPPTAKRLLIACMTQHMSASKTVSYNEASRVCKAQLRSHDAALASSAVKPVSGLSH